MKTVNTANIFTMAIDLRETFFYEGQTGDSALGGRSKLIHCNHRARNTYVLELNDYNMLHKFTVLKIFTL